MELMGIADEGAVSIDGQIAVTQQLGWKSVSYTHLTLPTIYSV